MLKNRLLKIFLKKNEYRSEVLKSLRGMKKLLESYLIFLY